MSRVYPSVYFGTLSAEAIRIVCIVPKKEKGVIVRSLDLFTAVEIAPGTSDYWVVEIGTIAGQMEFFARAQHATPRKGIAKGRNPVFFAKVVAYDPGETMALRARPVGDPADLTAFEVVVGIEEP